MAKRELSLVKETLFRSYSNLAMAHTAVERKQEKYATFNYMIRAKLFKGLMEGSMNTRTIFDDEKIKLLSGNKCSYCGATENLALDHIFPQKLGGKDSDYYLTLGTSIGSWCLLFIFLIPALIFSGNHIFFVRWQNITLKPRGYPKLFFPSVFLP